MVVDPVLNRKTWVGHEIRLVVGDQRHAKCHCVSCDQFVQCVPTTFSIGEAGGAVSSGGEGFKGCDWNIVNKAIKLHPI